MTKMKKRFVRKSAYSSRLNQSDLNHFFPDPASRLNVKRSLASCLVNELTICERAAGPVSRPSEQPDAEQLKRSLQ